MRLGRAMRRTRLIRLFAPLLALFLFAGALPAQTEARDPAGLLVAYSLKDGKELWRAKTPGYFSTTDVSRATLAGRSFDCGSGNGQITALATSDRGNRWQVPYDYDAPAPSGGESIATGAGTSGVIVVTDLSVVRGLDAKTGAERWKHRSKYFTTVTVDSSLVFVGEVRIGRDDTQTGAVTAYDRETGEKLWSRSLPRSAYQSAAVGRGVVALSATENNGTSPITVVVDAKNGKRRWSAPLASGGIADDVVILGTTMQDPDPRMEARDARTGKFLWRHELPARGAFTIGKFVLLGTDDKTRVAVDARTGNELAALPGLVWNGLGVAGEGKGVFAWTDAATLHLADMMTGEDRWAVALPAGFEMVQSTTIGNDAVYVSVGCYPMD